MSRHVFWLRPFYGSEEAEEGKLNALASRLCDRSSPPHSQTREQVACRSGGNALRAAMAEGLFSWVLLHRIGF